jgi:hypothetical protein
VALDSARPEDGADEDVVDDDDDDDDDEDDDEDDDDEDDADDADDAGDVDDDGAEVADTPTPAGARSTGSSDDVTGGSNNAS